MTTTTTAASLTYTTTQHTIPADRYDDLGTAVSRLNRHAKRLGLIAGDERIVTATKLRTRTVLVHVPENPPYYRAYDKEVAAVDVEVVAATASCGGYELVAVVERLETDAGHENLFRAVPEAKVVHGELEPFRGRGMECDHCKVQRRRSECYVVRKTSDDILMLVGSSCLKYVVGAASATDAEFIVAALPFLSRLRMELDEFGEGFGAATCKTLSLKTFLCFVAEDVAKNGYKAKKNCGDNEISTGQAAEMDLIKAQRSQDHALIGGLVQKHGDLVDDCIAFWAAIETATAKSDYEANISVLARARVVGPRSSTLAASMLPSWQRTIAAEAARKASPSKHQGVVGKRLRDLKLTVRHKHDFSGVYVKILHVMTDSEGNVYKWFSSGQSLDGDVVVDATVKEHGEYKGIKETIVTRVSAKVAAVAAA